MKKQNTDESYVFDPYASDDPNVGEVHYGAPDEFHDARTPADPSAFQGARAPAEQGGGRTARTPADPGKYNGAREPAAPGAFQGARTPSGTGEPVNATRRDFSGERRTFDRESAASRPGGQRGAGGPSAYYGESGEDLAKIFGAAGPVSGEKGGRRAARRGKGRIGIEIDGDADENSYGRRDPMGELDESGEKAISKKQLRRRVQSRSRRARRKPNVAVLIVVLTYALIVGACALYVIVGRHRAHNLPAETEPELVVSANDAATEQLEVPESFTTVALSSEDMHKGDLILVNYAYPYVFPQDADNVSVFDYKTSSYKVRDKNVTLSKAVTEKFNRLMDDFAAASGCSDMMVVSGFRDYDFQNEIWVDRVQTEGEAEAAKYVAVPGYSEHHTGLAMDLSVYLSDGRTVYVEEYEPCEWFVEHAPEYGFVLRYPSVKAATTHISYESWHYRYVGVPHAEIMYEKDLCLEEYVDMLRSYKFGEKYLAFKKGFSYESETLPEDAEYAVYYVPVFDGDTTNVPVPENADYEITGNNVDGFVVTVKYKD